ncbi:MAG: alanine--glyoxylate aminotransferase family protein [Lachnospiraceae bacterium]|nr:alanine--glyoxylate aminotransferase family protein [Lachnospiraceae bacterium]
MKNLLDGIQNTLLMGAGPSSVAPSTYYALSRSTLGHLDPYFIKIMDEVKEGLRTIMGTKNMLTVPMSGTGSIGMEAAFVNMVEYGDKVLVLQNGVFGQRMVDVASRLGAEVTELAFEWGTPVDINRVADKLSKEDYKIVAVVYAETSTGVRNPVEEIGKLLKDKDTFFLVDAVTALGGMPVEVDKWGIDICYSGSQKCLSCPPGASPITFSDRAVEFINNRKSHVPNWYLDMSLLTKYWEGNTRVYHHTPPINMFYGIYQAIHNILEEGMETVYNRHQNVHEQLVKGIEEMGWEMLVDKEYRLPMLNAIVVPEGIDEAALRDKLLKEYNTEISAGLGTLSGKIVRIGLMGYNAQPYNVEFVLKAIKEITSK